MKAGTLLLTIALASAAAAPLLPRVPAPHAAAASEFPGWPREFEGVALTRMAASPQDAFFARNFPGRIARFAADDRQIVIRWVNSPTRRLHPASHCFAGLGYAIEPRPMRRSPDGALMSCFVARKDGDALRVCEQLRDSAGTSSPDVSAWYWQALKAPAGSSWWSYVSVQREENGA
jgi:hypothetical protein